MVRFSPCVQRFHFSDSASSHRNAGIITYDNTSGPNDSFDFDVSDGFTFVSAIFNISINHAPVAVEDTYSTDEDTVLNVAAPGVLTNDSDVDGDPLTAVQVIGPANGTLTLNANGSFTYTPNADFNGTDTFTYRANDGTADSNVATVTITVTAVNDPPTLDPIGDMTIDEDAPEQTVNLTGITTGAANEIQTLVVTAVSSDPSIIPNPTVTYTSPNATGSLSFTPVPDANGSVNITVTVNDGVDTFQRTFTVTVTAVNDPPTLDPIGDMTIDEDAPEQTVNLTGITTGAANEIQTLVVTAVSSDPSIIPNPTVTYTSPNATGSLSFTPVPDANGSVNITVTVNDGVDTFQRTFTVTVTAVNDPPTLDPIGDMTIDEDAPEQTVNLTGITTGAANEIQTLVVTAVSSDPSIIPNPTVTYTSPNATGSLSFTPVPDANGSVNITVTVNDGVDTFQRTFTVTVTAVNDPPTLDPIGDMTIDEDAPEQTVNLTGITTGAANEIQTLVVTAVSSDPSIIPNPTVTYTSPNATGSLSFTPVPDANGSVNITVTVNDGVDTFQRTFTVTVTAVNDPPTLDPIGDMTIDEDAPEQTVNLTGITTGAANEIQTLVVTAVSSDPSIIPNPTVTYTSPNATGSLSFTPVPDANGSVNITVTVNDGVDTFQRTFTVTVTAVNDPPTLDPIGDMTIDEDAPEQTVNLTGITTGAANEIQTLVVTAVSSDPSIIPNPTVTYTSPNATGSLSFTPVPDANGSVNITVTVNDGVDTFQRTFTVTVTAVNDPPTLDPIGDMTIDEDAPEQTVNLTGITTGAANEIQTLVVTAVSSDPSIIPNPTVTYTSPNATGSLSFTPVPDANGSVNITVTVNDGVDTFQRTFTVTVTAVNDPPTLDPIGDMTIDEDAPEQTVNLTGITTGAANEIQTLVVTAVSSDPSIIPNPTVTYTSPNATGSLSFTPVPDANGSVNITVTVNDGVDTFQRTFTVTVTAVNDPPVADFSGTPLSGAAPLTVNFTDLSTDIDDPITSWDWDFGHAGGVSTAQNPSHIFLTSGLYTVTLTATDGFGATGTETKVDYVAVHLTIRITNAGTGTGTVDVTVMPSGMSAGTYTIPAGGSVDLVVAHGDTVTLSNPTPDASSLFIASNSDVPDTITNASGVVIERRAEFQLRKGIRITNPGTGTGTVNVLSCLPSGLYSGTQNIPAGGTLVLEVAEGDTVTLGGLTANPDSLLIAAGTTLADPETIVMGALDVDRTATFELKRTITITNPGSGTGTVNVASCNPSTAEPTGVRNIPAGGLSFSTWPKTIRSCSIRYRLAPTLCSSHPAPP
jgi:VCBS repeat-containing protein